MFVGVVASGGQRRQWWWWVAADCPMYYRYRLFYEQRASTSRYTARFYVNYPSTRDLLLLGWERLCGESVESHMAAIQACYEQVIKPALFMEGHVRAESEFNASVSAETY